MTILWCDCCIWHSDILIHLAGSTWNDIDRCTSDRSMRNVLPFGNEMESRNKSCHSISLNCLHRNRWQWRHFHYGKGHFELLKLDFSMEKKIRFCVSFRGRQADWCTMAINLHVACNHTAVCSLFAWWQYHICCCCGSRMDMWNCHLQFYRVCVVTIMQIDHFAGVFRVPCWRVQGKRSLIAWGSKKPFHHHDSTKKKNSITKNNAHFALWMTKAITYIYVCHMRYVATPSRLHVALGIIDALGMAVPGPTIIECRCLNARNFHFRRMHFRTNALHFWMKMAAHGMSQQTEGISFYRKVSIFIKNLFVWVFSWKTIFQKLADTVRRRKVKKRYISRHWIRMQFGSHSMQFNRLFE